MNRLFVIGLIFVLPYSCSEKRQNAVTVTVPVSNSPVVDTCPDMKIFHAEMRDRVISKEKALGQIQNLLPVLKKYFYENGGKDFLKSDWAFPVQGYNAKAIGGSNGSGYIVGGYDFFDGDKHTGHPAHDIFIADKNQDCLDDNTKMPVNILSMTGGIVVASESVWEPESVLRGGKYIWIYDPSSNSLYYYAHNNKVYVQPCDIVKPGDTIAVMGRTGLNAFKKRSPTHLHFMQLQLDENGYPRPVNGYETLSGLSK